MKELSIEEKAKAYDKVREKIALRFGSNVAEEIFSEFEESEDERIKKDIKIALMSMEDNLSVFYSTHHTSQKELLSWLEKQGKKPQKTSIWKHWKNGIAGNGEGELIYLIKVGNTYSLSSCLGFECDYIELSELDKLLLEKQGEQNPADKVEPKFKVKYAGSEYNVLEVKDIAGVTYYGIEDEPNHIDYVQAENCERVGGYGIKENGSPYPTKPAVFSEQKPAWSEEDKDYYDAIIAKLEVTQEDAALTDNQMEFLKSLKDRVQPQQKQEWSEEDEEILKDVINLLDGVTKGNTADITVGRIIFFIEWLKSLRPQEQWRPSEEHYELEEFAKIVRGNLTGISKAVQELFEAKYLQLTGNRMYGGFKD